MTSPLRPSTPTDPRLAEVVRRLVAVFAPERVYLFGSRARGEESPDSDYDLMLVLPDDAPAALRRSDRAYEVLWGLVLLWTRSAFDARVHLQASLPGLIVREGRLLHAA